MKKCVIWGIDENVEYAIKLVKLHRTDIEIVASGCDRANYPYEDAKLKSMSLTEVIELKERKLADIIILASTGRYLEHQYKELKDSGIEEVYAIPSYMYNKKTINEEDRRVMITLYEQLPPQLYYLEIHAADHCNLNCKGCTHFSNIVKGEKFPDIKEFSEDMRQLSVLFHNIEFIRILGGEPLLNPELEKMLEITRFFFSYAKIILVTNGILINNMSNNLIQSIKKNNIQITISVYPPIEENIMQIEKKLVDNKINFQFGERQNHYETCLKFSKNINRKGDEDQYDSWMKCKRKRCHFLYHGKLYGCAMPALVTYFNKYFEQNIVSSPGIDIYDCNMNGKSVLAQLNSPMDVCRYCGREEEFDWEQRTKNALESDWCVD